MSNSTLTAKIIATLLGWVKGTLLLALLYGIASFVLVMLLGMSHPDIRHYMWWLAILGGILYGVPYLGGIITAILFFTAGTVSGGFLFGIVSALIICTINLLFDYTVAPKILGASTGLHPLTTLTAILIGGIVGGPIGILVAVPIAAVLQVIIMENKPS